MIYEAICSDNMMVLYIHNGFHRLWDGNMMGMPITFSMCCQSLKI